MKNFILSLLIIYFLNKVHWNQFQFVNYGNAYPNVHYYHLFIGGIECTTVVSIYFKTEMFAFYIIIIDENMGNNDNGIERKFWNLEVF